MVESSCGGGQQWWRAAAVESGGGERRWWRAAMESSGGREQRWWRAVAVESSDRKKYYTEMERNERRNECLPHILALDAKLAPKNFRSFTDGHKLSTRAGSDAGARGMVQGAQTRSGSWQLRVEGVHGRIEHTPE
ncbi:hypothetical protein LR48_Vigan01g071100 [Vigna angularis]|uniref:Uncharacterized protein n=1 Tax=Phaseolus angularis TaxID=3914 RepID=A0A0L9TL01_PHAAN|nr:hypothetical protein LR48_Vigan01g071100 [Vigna angularis]